MGIPVLCVQGAGMCIWGVCMCTVHVYACVHVYVLVCVCVNICIYVHMSVLVLTVHIESGEEPLVSCSVTLCAFLLRQVSH